MLFRNRWQWLWNNMATTSHSPDRLNEDLNGVSGNDISRSRDELAVVENGLVTPLSRAASRCESRVTDKDDDISSEILRVEQAAAEEEREGQTTFGRLVRTLQVIADIKIFPYCIFEWPIWKCVWSLLYFCTTFLICFCPCIVYVCHVVSYLVYVVWIMY